MDLFPRTPAPSDPSVMADGLASARFDRAAALLCSVSSSAVRAAGTFASAGVPRVGGGGADGGESQSSLFCSLGGFVHVDPGGLGGLVSIYSSLLRRILAPTMVGEQSWFPAPGR
jgi:hypothetical protein